MKSYFTEEAEQELHPLLRRQLREASMDSPDGGISYDLLFQMVSESYADMDSPLTVGATGVTHVKENEAQGVERRFLSMVRNVPGVVYQWYERANGERGFYYISPRIKEFFGVEADVLMENPMALEIHPDDMPRWEESLQELVKHPRDWHFEGRFILPDGRIKWWRGLSKPTIISAMEVVFDGIILDIDEEKQREKKLRHIAEGTARVTGQAFLASLVEHLAKALNMQHAMIGVIDGDHRDRIVTRAYWSKGAIAENLSYPLRGTPCEKVTETGFCLFPEQVQALFPTDEMLKEVDAVSYLGTRLHDSKGKVIGLLACFDDKPLKASSELELMFTIFACRAATELERLEERPTK